MDEPPISVLLAGVRAGDRCCESQLVALVYSELRRLAVAHLRSERSDHTLQPSALVHEAYLRLFREATPTWENRGHFFTSAATTMRRILVDYARARRARKRDGALARVELTDVPASWCSADLDRLLTIDDALERLARWDPRQAKVVELRFFAGLTVDEAAQVLNLSAKTVKRDWSMARAWLQTQLDPGRGR